jgi:DNA-binding NarL/FixJ family response regulator
LQQEPGWEVIAQAGDGAEAIRLADELKPDLVVLDVAMPGLGGIETAEAIRLRSPKTRIVAVSMYSDLHYRKRMLAAGAAAYVLKNEAGADLIAAIHSVLQGETFISPLLESPSRRRDALQSERSPDLDQAALTGREREVLELLARGRRTKEIAAELGISAKTVETYRGRIMLKLGIDNLAGLVKFAIRAGIAPVDGDPALTALNPSLSYDPHSRPKSWDFAGVGSGLCLISQSLGPCGRSRSARRFA